jgi:hypothetical protein
MNLAVAASPNTEQKSWAEVRDSIASKLTPQQIVEAQRLAREWKPIKTK